MKTELTETKHCHNCVVFVTHKITEDIRKYLSSLKEVTDGVVDLLILYDCSSQPIVPADFPEFRFYIFNSSELCGFFHQQNRLLPNPLVALIECARQNRYDHYLLMENDIVLNGCFSAFIQRVNDESDVDYIHIASDVEGGPEKHWPIKYIKDNPFKHLYFSWCQLFYVSRRYLTDLTAFMQHNDSFYYEFLLPTMAYNGNYTVKQFENFGYRFDVSWGPAELYEHKYQYERTDKTFYHPIKNLSMVDFNKIVCRRSL